MCATHGVGYLGWNSMCVGRDGGRAAKFKRAYALAISCHISGSTIVQSYGCLLLHASQYLSSKPMEDIETVEFVRLTCSYVGRCFSHAPFRNAHHSSQSTALH